MQMFFNLLSVKKKIYKPTIELNDLLSKLLIN